MAIILVPPSKYLLKPLKNLHDVLNSLLLPQDKHTTYKIVVIDLEKMTK